VLWLLLSFFVALASSSSSSTSRPFWRDWTVWLLRAGSETATAASNNDTTVIANNNNDPESLNGISSQKTSVEPADNNNETSLEPLTNRAAAREWTSQYPNNSSVALLYSEEDTADSQSPTTSVQETEDERANALTNKRQRFLDRIAVISSSLMRREDDESTLQYKSNHQDTDDDDDDDTTTDWDAITPQSDLSRPGRRIHVVTTAALPWFTGTAVNPLLRAAYLHRYTQEINRCPTTTSTSTTTLQQQPQQRWVTFVIPWLEWPEDQQTLYGRVFANCSEQEDYIRAWLRDDAEMADAACPTSGLEMVFYPARYHAGLGSIFAMGDIMEMVVSSSSSSSFGVDQHNNNG
jgi:hypothetical protein